MIVARIDATSVQLHNPSAQEQSNAGTALPEHWMCIVLLRLEETVEDTILVSFHNTIPRIADINIQLTPPLFTACQRSGIDVNMPIVGGELDGIGYQVDQCFPHISRIQKGTRICHVAIQANINAPFPGEDLERQEQFSEELHQMAGPAVQSHLIHVQLAEIHQFVYQREQVA